MSSLLLSEPINLVPPQSIKSTISHRVITLLDTKCNSLDQLKQTHAHIIRNNLAQHNFTLGSLIKHSANSNFANLDYALMVFKQIDQPHSFIWNSMIRGYLENNAPHESILFYCKMVMENAQPDKYTFPSLLKACTLARAVEEGKQIHTHVVKHGLGGDAFILSAGIQMYASCGRMFDARQLFDEGPERDGVLWNAMIDGYLKNGNIEAARELFERMPCKNIGSWNVMISYYAKCGMIGVSRQLFDEMPERDDVSWSAIIDGYVQAGFYKEALAVFHEMQRERVRPRKFVLSSVLTACANVGALDQGRWIHAYVERNSMLVDAVLGTSLVDMYAKCGRLNMAWEVFGNIKCKEVFSWNAMMGGLAMYGQGEDAIKLFLHMQREKFKPDGITFVGVLNACAHAGLVEQGLEFFDSIKEVYGIEPKIEHYGCMVDLLGRAGLFVEAEEIIRTMPMKPNAAIWGALLGACRIHGNVELAERLGEILLELEPYHSGRYALLSNIYAAANRWDDVLKVRKLMKERGVKTTPGSSLIDLDGVIHEFVMGDGSHPQMKEIHLMLEEITERLKLVGYLPNTTQVLFDIDEEQKESTLNQHSEKLAIAFGFLNTAPGAPIRITKNLRVCEDCHSVTKLISSVYNREIVVRDRVRYHCFKDGRCSCRDFW